MVEDRQGHLKDDSTTRIALDDVNKNKEVRSREPSEHYESGEIAQSYDCTRFETLPERVFDALEKRSIRKVFSSIPANSLILDAPCGTGRLSEVMLELGHRVVGVDISPAMLEVAKQKLARFENRFEARVRDVHELTQDREQFDAALCARVLMHFPLQEQKLFLQSVARVTRGIVVFNQLVDTPYNSLRRRVKKLLGGQEPVSFPITFAESDSLIEAAGLTLERRTGLLPGVSEAVLFVCH